MHARIYMYMYLHMYTMLAFDWYELGKWELIKAFLF